MSTEETHTTLPPEMSKEGGGIAVKKAKGRTLQRYGPPPAAGRTICCGLLAFLVLAGVIALILYLVYRPSSPSITVVGATVYELHVNSSAAAATTVSASMQFTLRLRNPNERSAVLYDRLLAFVVSREQAITGNVVWVSAFGLQAFCGAHRLERNKPAEK